MNKTTLSILAVSMFALLAVGTVAAFGFGKGGLNADLSEEELAQMQEQKQAMQTAVENQDYATWQNLMLERVEQMRAQITPENFNNIVEQNENQQAFHEAVQELKDSGDFSREDMESLREQYNLEAPEFKEGRKAMGMKPEGDCSFAR